MSFTEEFRFEVPIVSLDDTIPNNCSLSSFDDTEDQDCTIVEPKNPLEATTNDYNPKELTNLINVPPIVIEEDNDCTIIEDQIVSHIVTGNVNNNKPNQLSFNSMNPKYDSQCSNNSINVDENSQESGSQNTCNKQSVILNEENIEPIVLDEDSERENDCSIIEINIVSEKQSKSNLSSENGQIANCSSLEQNKVLVALIEKCLNMENSTGMLRIVNRTLVPIYKETSEEFKNSDYFQSFLAKTLTKLNTEPHKKFSHLRDLCDLMKGGLPARKENKDENDNKACKNDFGKKRVQLTTLKRKLNDDEPVVKLSGVPSKDTQIANFSNLYKKNKILVELIEKCLNMENSTEMLNIVNKTLVPIYKDTSEQFKNSDHFQRVLTKTLIKLDAEPQKKLSHLKELCDLMNYGLPKHARKNIMNKKDQKACKSDDGKKRVQFTTLKSKVDGKFTSAETNSSCSSPKKSKSDIIDLDDENDDDVIIGDSDTANDVRHYMEVTFNNNVAIHESHTNDINEHRKDETNEHSIIDDDIIFVENENQNSNKENLTFMSGQSKRKPNGFKVADIDLYNDEQINNINELLNPKKVRSSELAIQNKIKDLEVRIKYYNEVIEELDTEEVDWNRDDQSSYLQSEYYKAKVVRLYKHLCKLTGTESVKRHRVRLKVVEGRHEGPVRCLEEYINNNIDKNGNPPFPDMLDVIQCVRKANDLYLLRWTKKQIETEAQALFIHFGRTVQKRRQKREWRDLMRYVKTEAPDPADGDPALQARLETNAVLAVKNERDLLDRYAQMENSNVESIDRINIECSDSEYDSDNNQSTTRNETVSNNETLHNSTIEINSKPEHNNISVIRNTTVINNTDTPNYETVPNNSNRNQESYSDETTESLIIFDPTNVSFSQLILPPEVRKFPIKSIVVDDDMKLVGVIATPPANLRSNMKEFPNASNSRNTIDTVQQNNNGNKEPEIDNQMHINLNVDTRPIIIESNEANKDIVANTALCSTNVNSEVNESSEPYDADCSVLQYNEISTNSYENMTTTNVKVENAAINNDVSSTSEPCADSICEVGNVTSGTGSLSCEVVKNERPSPNIVDTCELVNDKEPSKTGDKTCKLHNDAESTKTDKTCEIGNDTGLTVEGKTCESLNDAGSSNTDLNEVIVKKEKLDIPSMLEALGDDYTVTIIGIEDPFEVIEISDSSDSEDEL